MARSRNNSQIPRKRLRVCNISVYSLATYNARHHHNLLGSTVKLFNTLYRFASLYFEGGCAPSALLIEDTLGLADCRSGLRITYFCLLHIPRHPLVTAPGHDP